MRSFKYLHCCLGIVPHGVHKYTRKETHQRQTHLTQREVTELKAWREEKLLEASLQWVQSDLWPNQLVWGHLGEKLCSLSADLGVCAVTKQVQQIDQSTCKQLKKIKLVNPKIQIDMKNYQKKSRTPDLWPLLLWLSLCLKSEHEEFPAQFACLK